MYSDCLTKGKNLLRFKRENTKGKERGVAVTKKKAVIIGIAAVFAAAAALVLCNIGYSSYECDRLTPSEVSEISEDYNEEDAVTVSFALKRHISPKGWGFKKQVVFEEKTAFYMDSRSYDDSRLYNKGIKYGIYKDSLLAEPVAEIDFDRARDEENGEYFIANINTVLEPGAYYIGITSKMRNISPFSFIAQYSYIYDE